MKNLNFYSLDASNNQTLRMMVNESGNVGIGTSIANRRLEVAGDISFNGDLYKNGEIFTGGSTIDETTDVSLNNLKVHGDLSANDASFNVIDASSINTSSTSYMQSIIPAADNTYSLGDPSNVWKDVYIGPGSLYIDGQKVLESNADTIVVGADENQNLKLNTHGSGVLQIESASGIQITSTGSGNIELGSTGSGIVRITDNLALNGDIEIYSDSSNNVKINDNLNVTGEYLQNGANINTIYATLASPTLTGTPLAPTATSGTNTTQIATTAFVTTAVSNLVNSAPAALDTLSELAAALDNSANFATNVTTTLGDLQTQINAKQDSVSTDDLDITDVSGLSAELTDLSNNKHPLISSSNRLDAAFIHDGTVSNTEFGYLNGVTSGLQTQLDAKTTASSTDTFTNKTIDVDATGNSITNIANANIKAAAGIVYSKLSIADGDLTIAKTSGLQAALDAKQATITTDDLAITDVSGLTAELADLSNNKQDTLIAGTNITITNNTISASGGGGVTIDETTDVSLNNLFVHGDISANDASFNRIDVSEVYINGVDLMNGAPEALDTLKELADALDNSANFAANVTNTLGSLQTQVDAKQITLTANTDIEVSDIVCSTITIAGSNTSGTGSVYTWSVNSTDLYYTTGNVGIGTSSPTHPLHIASSETTNLSGIAYQYFNSTTSATDNSGSNHTIGLRVEDGIWCEDTLFVSSDRRIKENIVDVPDDLALQQLRHIPTRYYEYKDKTVRGSDQTIGFIAQEVKQVMPMAVSLQQQFIPDVMEVLTDVSWEQSITISNEINHYYLRTSNPLFAETSTSHATAEATTTTTYRFYVGDQPDGSDAILKEVTSDLNHRFVFDYPWKYVFCYGKKVNDFHTVDKNKLFALNFSATQELDRLFQTQQLKINQQQTTLEEQQNEIEQLKMVNQDMNNQLNTLTQQNQQFQQDILFIKQHLNIQ